MKRLLCLCAFMANTAFGSAYTIGPHGIDSKATGLDGSHLPHSTLTAVRIGQVEHYRSAKAGYDSPHLSAPNTIPGAVYYGTFNNVAPMDQHLHFHPTEVAEVMIGKAEPNATYEGVAPKADLSSLALENWEDDSLNAVAMQSMASHSMDAINISFGRGVDAFDADGASLLTQFIDWSARRHDTLYVILWPNNDVPHDFTAPDDNFNGITVAASSRYASDPDDAEDDYYVFAPTNREPVRGVLPRTYIDLLAPGQDIEVMTLGGDRVTPDGTSYAVPHVTGTVALMGQYIYQQQVADNPRFLGIVQHYTKKAILMNAADKLAGVHGSRRTIINDLGQNWTQTAAYADPATPLDAGMGAGHLNARRAIEQLAPGNYDPIQFGGPVPKIGWSNPFSLGPGDIHEYVFDPSSTVRGWNLA